MVYDALVEYSFLYSKIAWGPTYKSNLNQLQISQNNNLISILNKKLDYNVINLYEEFNVLFKKNLL